MEENKRKEKRRERRQGQGWAGRRITLSTGQTLARGSISVSR